jgi:hypothetical protein
MSDLIPVKENLRPKGLRVLSILTLIFTGVGFLFDALLLLTLHPNDELIRTQKVAVAKQVIELQKENNDDLVTLVQQLGDMNVVFIQHHVEYRLVTMFVALIAVAAVVLMLRQRILGFHLYIIYSLAYVGNVYLFLSPKQIPNPLIWFNAIIALTFILLYARHRKWMEGRGD